MIRSNISVIDPINDPHQWFVVWTTSRTRVYLIQTFRDSARHEASMHGAIGYRYIQPVPCIDEFQLATMVLEEPACWRWRNEEKLIIQLVDFSFSGSSLLQVVAGSNSLETGMIKLGSQAFLHATSADRKLNFWSQTSPVTHIFAGDPIDQQ